MSADGKSVAAIGGDHKAMMFPIDGGTPRVIPGVEEGEYPARFSPDGRWLYVWKRGDVPAKVTRIEVRTANASPSRS